MIEKKLVFTVLIFVVASHGADKSDSLYFVANNKGLDYKIAGKKDAHRFGVELKENKQFHHTITAEDGVRLGCYGYELNGMKYSTNYIADGKGYRLAPNQDLITVFAKGSSEARVASFKESFSAEEIEKANIKYFFPEGCEAPKIFYDPNNPSTAFEHRRQLFNALVQKAQAEQLKKNLSSNSRDEAAAAKDRSNNNSSNLNISNNNNSNSSSYNESHNINGQNNSSTSTSANNNLIKNPQGGSDILPHSLSSQSKSGHPGLDYSRRGKSTLNGGVEDGACCVTGIQIELPHSSIASACSGKTARIIIPIDSEKLSSVPMKELMDISKQTSSTSSMLTELQKLAAKYEL